MSEGTKTTSQHSASAAGVNPGDTYGLKDFEPAKYAVNGEKILNLLIQTIERFLVLPKHGALIIALWVFFTHAYQCFDINPRLALLSPEKRCGKTTLFDLLTHVTPRALLASHVTPAVVFRLIDLAGPTLFIDEFDSFKNLAEELRGILNSGHRRAGAVVYRCVGDTHQPKAFSTFANMAFAAIGNLPDTLKDRSISVLMRRRAQAEIVKRLRWSGKQGEALRSFLSTLASSIARWVSDHREALCEYEPTIPEELNDRAADNWFPLLAIAEMISEQCADRARAASTASTGTDGLENESVRIQLLHDVRSIVKNDETELKSRDACQRLVTLEECPWASWRHGRPLSPAQLARLLRPFEIRSRDIWQNGKCAKGYLIGDFNEAFDRYLPPLVPERETARIPAASGNHTNSESARSRSSRASQSTTIAVSDNAPRVLADQNGGMSRTVQDDGRNARYEKLSKMWRRVKAIKEPRG